MVREEVSLINQVEAFIKYLEHTWVGTAPNRKNAMFDRKIWNFHCQHSNRTNNICESYNKRINNLVTKDHPSIYAIIDVLKSEETLTAVNFNKAR